MLFLKFECNLDVVVYQPDWIRLILYPGRDQTASLYVTGGINLDGERIALSNNPADSRSRLQEAMAILEPGIHSTESICSVRIRLI